VSQVNLLHIIGPVFANGQPSRIVALIDPTCPSPVILKSAEESWNKRFGFTDLLDSNTDWFPQGVFHGVNPTFGLNLSMLPFCTSDSKAKFMEEKYDPLPGTAKVSSFLENNYKCVPNPILRS
jgi:hypothetical protein